MRLSVTLLVLIDSREKNRFLSSLSPRTSVPSGERLHAAGTVRVSGETVFSNKSSPLTMKAVAIAASSAPSILTANSVGGVALHATVAVQHAAGSN